MKYFISFMYQIPSADIWGYGNAEISSLDPITSLEQLKEIEQEIATRNSVSNVVIMNYNPMTFDNKED